LHYRRRNRMKKFMKAIEDVTSFIGTNSGIQRRSGNERREQIKKVPKKVKSKRKTIRRK
jgi:hypothetical protein